MATSPPPPLNRFPATSKDSDHILHYPAPDFMQPTREQMGPIRSPPPLMTPQPVGSSCHSNRTQGTTIKRPAFHQAGFHSPRTPGDTLTDCGRLGESSAGITSPIVFDFQNCGRNDSTSDSRNIPIYRQQPTVSSREFSRKVDSGILPNGRWSRREENLQETSASSSRMASARVPNGAATPTTTFTTNSTLPSYLHHHHHHHQQQQQQQQHDPKRNSTTRVRQTPVQIRRSENGDIVETVEETVTDDNVTETIYRRTKRTTRLPPSPAALRKVTSTKETVRTSTSGRLSHPSSRTLPVDYQTRQHDQEKSRITPSSHVTRNHSYNHHHQQQQQQHQQRARTTSQKAEWPTARGFGLSQRTLSQSNVNQQHTNTMRNHWTSAQDSHFKAVSLPLETNLRSVPTLKQPPLYGTYSAHQENLRHRNASAQQAEHHRSTHHVAESGYGEIIQETISLQPIGRGVQDLESSSTTGTLTRGQADAETASKYSIDQLTAAEVRGVGGTSKRHQLPPRPHDRLKSTTGGRPTPMSPPPPKPPPTSPASNAPRRRHSYVEGSKTRSYSLGPEGRGGVSPAPSRHPMGGGQGHTTAAATGQTYAPHQSRMTHNESHWHNGLNVSTGSLPGPGVGVVQMTHTTVDSMESRHNLLPHSQNLVQAISPEEARRNLVNREPGHCVVCPNPTNPNTYLLVVRVPITAEDPESVRSFVLNRVGGGGVQLQGSYDEAVYPSLSAFLHDHTLRPGGLPIPLRLASGGSLRAAHSTGYLAGGGPSHLLTGPVECDMLYLGSVDVFPLKGTAAIRRAVQQVLDNANNTAKGLRRKCEASVCCVADKNITIYDRNGARFTKKVLSGKKILVCAYDPEERVFNGIELKNRGVADSQIFAIVVKKSRFTMTEHTAYVMCQLEPNQASSNLINYINQNFVVLRR